MKNKVQNPFKIGLLLAAFLMVGSVTYGATYTAVVSGNWSNAATWGGSAPPFNITASDQILIGAGMTVTMDQAVTLNNLLAGIDVVGTLTADAHVGLTVVSGVISGSGSISASTVIFDAGGLFNFSGALVVDTLSNAIVNLSNSAQITVNEALEVSSVLNLVAGGALTMAANSNIVVSGGDIVNIGGTLNLNATYNVYYAAGALNAGAELTGSGVHKVTVNVGASNNVALSANLVTNDSLKILSGALALNGYNLTVNGALTGNVNIKGAAASNLTINTSGGVAAAIAFPVGSQTLGSLAINVGSGHSVQIGSALNVAGNLSIAAGNSLNITGQNLMIGGNVNANGNFVVDAGSQLNFESGSSITGNISLSGAALGTFMLNIGNSNRVVLATDLTVNTLSLQTGILVLNSHNLIVNTDIAAGGSGMIVANAVSNITVATAAAVSGELSFSAAADTVHNLNVNIGGGGSLKLGSNLVVANALAFTAGYVDVQGNNLMIAASASITGANSNAYVITGVGGYLTMNASVNTNVTFQVGIGANDYLPAVINLNNGSAVGTIGLNVSGGVYANGNAGTEISNYEPMVDATWLFQNNIGAGLNANMQLSWQASAEVNGFVHTNDYISHYASAWDNIGDTMAATLAGNLYTVTRANITSMSPFAVFDKSTVATGVASIAAGAGEFVVYPNPTNENLYVKNPSANGSTVYVEVYNTLGQVVATTQYNNDLLVLPVSSLPEGNYLLRMYNDNMSVVKKFVKVQ